jgi:GMP synthase (glutamine-hydrolysing)
MKALVAINEWTDPLGALEPPLLEAGIELAFWHAQHETPPTKLGEFGALIALGGATNPDEDAAQPWLGAERTMLRTAVAQTLPVLGVCLGAQLLAQALGASAHKLPATRVGWHALRASDDVEDDPLGGAWASLNTVLEWHTYGFELPDHAVLLAGSRRAVQAFRAGPCAWGFQYHLEATAETVGRWIDIYDNDVRDAGVDPADLSTTAAQLGVDAAAHGAAVGAAFASIMTGRLPTRPTPID